jgi:hypothetical protein
MEEVQNAALAHHGVEVQVLLQPFPELHGKFVEGVVAGKKIIGPDDRRVAPHVSRAEPPLLQHRHVPDAELLDQIVSGRQSVPPSPHHDDIVAGLGRRIAPRRAPFPIAAQSVQED